MENSLLTLKNVTHEVVDNTLVISITKGAQFNSFIHVDDIIESTSKVKIICKENSFVKLLVEKYDAKQKIEFVLERNANVKLNFLSLEHKAAGEYTFDLAEASELHVAMADLSDANIDFTSVTVAIDVLCPASKWLIDDICPRPFKIMESIEEELEGSRVTGIGTMNLVGGDMTVPYAGITDHQMVFEVTANG